MFTSYLKDLFPATACSMVPAMARASSARISYRSLGKPKSARTIALVWNKRSHLSRAAIELREYIQSIARPPRGLRS